MANTPSSIVCFKNGFSFVTVPVLLGQDQPGTQEAQNDPIKSCIIGPLPSFAVHGTVGLLPESPESVKIFSLSKAAKKDGELKIPAGPDYSYHAILQANQGNTVTIQVNKGGNGAQFISAASLEKMTGLVKWVQPPTEKEAKMAVLETSENNLKLDKFINTEKIVHLERGVMEGTTSTSLEVRYVSTEPGPRATLSYLTNGLTWAPSYSVLMIIEITRTTNVEGKFVVETMKGKKLRSCM